MAKAATVSFDDAVSFDTEVHLPMPEIAFDDLASFAAELLVAGGATSEEARTVGSSLARSDALGYASHGVMRISFYLDMLQRGDLVSLVDLFFR